MFRLAMPCGFCLQKGTPAPPIMPVLRQEHCYERVQKENKSFLFGTLNHFSVAFNGLRPTAISWRKNSSIYYTVVGVSHSQRWQFLWNSLFIDSRGMLTGDQCGVMDDPNVDKGRCWNDLTDTMMMMVMTMMVQIMMITILDGDFIRE